jgi:hypothetical protein
MYFSPRGEGLGLPAGKGRGEANPVSSLLINFLALGTYLYFII